MKRGMTGNHTLSEAIWLVLRCTLPCCIPYACGKPTAEQLFSPCLVSSRESTRRVFNRRQQSNLETPRLLRMIVSLISVNQDTEGISSNGGNPSKDGNPVGRPWTRIHVKQAGDMGNFIALAPNKQEALRAVEDGLVTQDAKRNPSDPSIDQMQNISTIWSMGGR